MAIPFPRARPQRQMHRRVDWRFGESRVGTETDQRPRAGSEALCVHVARRARHRQEVSQPAPPHRHETNSGRRRRLDEVERGAAPVGFNCGANPGPGAAVAFDEQGNSTIITADANWPADFITPVADWFKEGKKSGRCVAVACRSCGAPTHVTEAAAAERWRVLHLSREGRTRPEGVLRPAPGDHGRVGSRCVGHRRVDLERPFR